MIPGIYRLCADHCYSIYGELGPGERIAFAKLAVEHFERTGRPLRIAIDISIWQFQIQSGKGGSNPALRTLYYRLLRLLALNVQPFFVFDGPNKPPFKRNVRTQPHTASLPNFLAKQLLKLFGFPYHTAPGEAEAECALFQRDGLVDAVMSEDVDTLMFGCTLSMKNWSSEGTRGNKSPTHISFYDAGKLGKSKAGLDREGMVLVALMSGGDYIPAGIPGCGIKTACQAAKAGFGHDLCKLSHNDTLGIDQWRERLDYELRTNESGYFKVKHKSLKIPQTFPDKAVLGYYTHPVVSPSERLSNLKQSLNWDQEVDVVGLRGFVAEAFEWQNLSGAKKFIRGLAPALLAHKLRVRGENGWSSTDNSSNTTIEREYQLAQAICGRRTHFITDGTPELRITYLPTSIVSLDLDLEQTETAFERDGGLFGGHLSDSADEPRSRSASPSKSRAPSQYDPTEPDKIWLLESFVKIGVPLTVETWEEEMRNPIKFATRKGRAKQTLTKGGMKKGALNPFVKTSKPGMDRTMRTSSCDASDMTIPPVFLAPATGRVHKEPSEAAVPKVKQKTIAPSQGLRKGAAPLVTQASTPSTKAMPMERSFPNPVTADNDVNPWTLSRRPSDTFNVTLPKGTRYSALGIYGSPEDTYIKNEGLEDVSHGYKSGHASPCLSPPNSRKHTRSLSPPSKPDTSTHMKTVHSHDLRQPTSPNPAAGIAFPSPLGIELNGPSSHKKRSPTTTAKANASELIQPQTPSTLRKTLLSTNILDTPSSDNHYAQKPLSSQRVNRRIDFTKALDASPATTSTSSLPSPSILLSQPSRPTNRTNPTEIAPFPPPEIGSNMVPLTLSRRSTGHPRSKRMIALRDSLAGTWKEVDEHEARARKSVYQGVDVLDLSNSPREH